MPNTEIYPGAQRTPAQHGNGTLKFGLFLSKRSQPPGTPFRSNRGTERAAISPEDVRGIRQTVYYGAVDAVTSSFSHVRHRDAVLSQSKTKERIRDLAEVFTNAREVDAMLDLLPDMFPSESRPRDIGRTFLEPACGAGNFLVAILDRKLTFVTFGARYRSVGTFEAAVLKAVSSIYGIDIDPGNVEESRQFLRADIAHHMNAHLNTFPVTSNFWSAVNSILQTNIVCADTLRDAREIRLVEYRWERRAGFVSRHWCYYEEPDDQLDLFGIASDCSANDLNPIHYSQLADNPILVQAELKHSEDR